MQGNLSALGEVTETLCSLEAALLAALRDENSPAGIAPVADIDDLSGLKSVLDRLRPLLWVYLSRVSENHRTYPMTHEKREEGGMRKTIDAAHKVSRKYTEPATGHKATK